MKVFQEKIVKPIIIVAVIIALTLVDFITISVDLISYAVGNMDVTNVNNVLFSAAFLDENNNGSESIEANMQENNLKLRLDIKVEKEGYFNGEIQIKNSNFKLNTNFQNEYVNTISENNIKLNQINVGQEVILDLEIQPLKDDKYNLEYINKVSDIQILGTYIMGKNSAKQINSTRQVQLKLNPKYSSENVESTVNVVTNKIYELDGENKRVVQLEIATKLSGNEYPIKSTKIESEVIENAEKVEVSTRGTYATNNNLREIESNWNKDNNKIECTISNPEENGSVEWNKNGNDKILITYILPEDTVVSNTQIEVNSQIELYDENDTTVEAKSNVTLGEEKDGAIVCELQTLKELYKGNLYYGEETTVNTKSSIDIRVKDISNTITIKEGNATYQDGNSANLKYRSTKINKEDVRRLLGNNGKIEILSEDGTILATINKASIDQTESEKVEVGYEGGRFITIRIVDAENEGRIVFENEQILQEDKSLKEYLKKCNQIQINGSSESDKNIAKQETSKSIELKEPETYATLTSNINTLSTMQTNENVEFNVILKTDNIKYDLYKNPIIELQLPSEITNINASFNTVFLDGLQVKSANIYDAASGNKAIRVELEGEQTVHSNNISEGIIIKINASIDVNKLANTKDSEIKMLYTNENSPGNVYEQNLPIKIKSKDGVLVYNKIENFNTKGDILETEEPETLNQIIKADSQGREVNANTVLLNNYSDAINNVTIVGKNADDTTIDFDILKSIEVNKDSKISYSENGENWTQNVEELQNIKAYKIEISQIATAETMTLNYGFKLPEQLRYNQIGKLEQNITYTYQGEELSQNFGLELQTENRQAESNNTSGEDHTNEVTGELEVNTVTKLGEQEISEKDTVYEGETLKNIITISNKTGQDVNNVNIKINQQNAVLYDLKEKTVYNYDISDQPMIEHSYEELETGEKSFDTIKTIKSGEVINLEYEAVVKEVDGDNNKTYGDIEITADNRENINKKTIENTIKQAEVKINSRFALNEEVELYSDYSAKTIMTIKNINNEDVENVNVKIQLAELYLESKEDIEFYNEDEEEINASRISDLNYNESDNTVTFKLNKLLKDEKIEVVLGTIAKKISLDKKQTTSKITTTATIGNNTYNSNIATRNITQSEKDIKVLQETALEENKTLKNGDTFNIRLIVNNNADEEINFDLSDDIDEVLEINSVKMNEGSTEKELENSYYEDNSFLYSGKIKAKSKIEFEINVTVNTEKMEDTEITNVAYLETDDGAEATSNELTFNIEETDDSDADDGDDDNNDSNENNNNNGGATTNGNAGENRKYTISGTAWLDKNKDGRMSNNEEKLPGIKVKLANKNTGEFIQNTDTETDQNGNYKFTVENGEYIIVFLYDAQKYSVTEYKKSGIGETENSDALSKNVTIDNTETVAGITDSITVSGSDVNNISIGLIEKAIFDLKLDKYISKVSVQNKQGVSVHNYNNEQLAKIEIKSKYYKGSTVVVEYKIAITNEGEVVGYASDIVDYIPSELKFSSELNKDWYASSDGNLHNSSLANQKIKAGETKELTLVLTKTLREDEGGLISNTAEIGASSNNQNIEDRDSTAGNRVTGEDDISTAGIIISVGTGIVKICLIGIFIILLIVGIVMLIMKRKEGENSEEYKK